MRGRGSLAWMLLLSLPFFGGCGGPTDPVPEPIVLQGELTRGTQVSHDVPLADSGVVRVELIALTSTNQETGEVFDLTTSVLSFSLGRVNTATGQSCSATFATALAFETPLSVFLTPVERCALVTDPGGLDPGGVIPEGFTWQYTIELSSTQ